MAKRVIIRAHAVSTHSRPKAAGRCTGNFGGIFGFNTQPPEGGCHTVQTCVSSMISFQHTAARRRLVWPLERRIVALVSTHSRPKAAGLRQLIILE